MATHHFNRDMDKYLEQRRQNDMQESISQEEDMDEYIEQPKKEGFFSRLFKKKEDENLGEGVEVVDHEQAPLDEDIRYVLKLSYGWLSYLPKHKLDAFKESNDFILYKDVLRKYGLIK